MPPPQVDYFCNQGPKKKKMANGDRIDALLSAATELLWKKLKSWGLLLPEEVLTTPWSEIRRAVDNIRPAKWEIKDYAHWLLVKLWHENMLPVKLVLFWRYPRANDVAYEIVFALLVYFGEERIRELTEDLANFRERTRKARRNEHPFWALGRKLLPTDFVERCVEIYGLNAVQQHWVEQWAQKWPFRQVVALKALRQIQQESFVTRFAQAQDEPGPVQENHSELAPPSPMEEAPPDVAGPVHPDPWASFSLPPLEDFISEPMSDASVGNGANDFLPDYLLEEAPGMQSLDQWAPNLEKDGLACPDLGD